MTGGRTLLLSWVALALTVSGCGAGKPIPAAPPPTDQAVANTPEAKIHVSYAHTDDYLDSMVVTKYAAADTLVAPANDAGAAIVRFDAGVVVWQFAVEKAFLSGLPVVGSGGKKYAPAEIKYGDLPEHFLASIPDSGPPEPLETGDYYIFAVTRGSGSVSYEAVKVAGDGSLEVYEADPRAGSSFRLCCNIAPDFTVAAPP
jgi:hypothetical protein